MMLPSLSVLLSNMNFILVLSFNFQHIHEFQNIPSTFNISMKFRIFLQLSTYPWISEYSFNFQYVHGFRSIYNSEHQDEKNVRLQPFNFDSGFCYVYSCSEKKKSGKVSTCRIGPFPCQTKPKTALTQFQRPNTEQDVSCTTYHKENNTATPTLLYGMNKEVAHTSRYAQRNTPIL
jgi:hypothetical protein